MIGISGLEKEISDEFTSGACPERNDMCTHSSTAPVLGISSSAFGGLSGSGSNLLGFLGSGLKSEGHE
jgi:hypothetical protein